MFTCYVYTRNENGDKGEGSICASFDLIFKFFNDIKKHGIFHANIIAHGRIIASC